MQAVGAKKKSASGAGCRVTWGSAEVRSMVFTVVGLSDRVLASRVSSFLSCLGLIPYHPYYTRETGRLFYFFCAHNPKNGKVK